jgi:hypothetical protein
MSHGLIRLTSGFDRTLPTDVIMLDDSGSKWTITSMQVVEDAMYKFSYRLEKKSITISSE